MEVTSPTSRRGQVGGRVSGSVLCWLSFSGRRWGGGGLRAALAGAFLGICYGKERSLLSLCSYAFYSPTTPVHSSIGHLPLESEKIMREREREGETEETKERETQSRARTVASAASRGPASPPRYINLIAISEGDTEGEVRAERGAALYPHLQRDTVGGAHVLCMIKSFIYMIIRELNDTENRLGT